jgi:hypothetical protein
MKKQLNEEFIHMQKLAGIIKESVNESNDLKVKWLKTDLNKYYEKGLANGFEMVNGKKVKEIIGYYEDEKGNEEVDTIGYIHSTSKDIESYSEDKLDDAFMSSLKSNIK